MAALKSYRELDVWQKAMDLVMAIYKLTSRMPDDERYGLISQTRRSAVSVPSNIAEGYGRETRPDYRRHVSIANGSLKELETQLILAGRLGYFEREDAADAWRLTQEVGMMLNRLKSALQEDNYKSKGTPARNPEPETRNPKP
jgi:four helix bundle protein